VSQTLPDLLAIQRRQLVSTLDAFHRGVADALRANLMDPGALQETDRVGQRLGNVVRALDLLADATHEPLDETQLSSLDAQMRAFYTTPEEHALHDELPECSLQGDINDVDIF